jgi:homoserine/homoserine lactone efflux protein
MDTHVWLTYVVSAILFSLALGSSTINSISNGLSYGTRKLVANC